jgi:hypothetical protein
LDRVVNTAGNTIQTYNLLEKRQHNTSGEKWTTSRGNERKINQNVYNIRKLKWWTIMYGSYILQTKQQVEQAVIIKKQEPYNTDQTSRRRPSVGKILKI